MTSELDNDVTASSGDRRRSRAYHRDFWPGMLGYVLVLSAVIAAGGPGAPSPWRYVWALLPMVPAVWVIWAVIKHVRRLDDYQRLLLLQGLAVGFALAMIASLTMGFLGVAGLSVPAAGWIIYGVGMLGWAVTGGLAARR